MNSATSRSVHFYYAIDNAALALCGQSKLWIDITNRICASLRETHIVEHLIAREYDPILVIKMVIKPAFAELVEYLKINESATITMADFLMRMSAKLNNTRIPTEFAPSDNLDFSGSTIVKYNGFLDATTADPDFLGRILATLHLAQSRNTLTFRDSVDWVEPIIKFGTGLLYRFIWSVQEDIVLRRKVLEDGKIYRQIEKPLRPFGVTVKQEPVDDIQLMKDYEFLPEETFNPAPVFLNSQTSSQSTSQLNQQFFADVFQQWPLNVFPFNVFLAPQPTTSFAHHASPPQTAQLPSPPMPLMSPPPRQVARCCSQSERMERKRLRIIDYLRPEDSDKPVTRCADALLARMVEDGVNGEDRPSMYQIKKVIGEMRKKRKSNAAN